MTICFLFKTGFHCLHRPNLTYVRRNETRFSKKLTLSMAKNAGCWRLPRLDKREIHPRGAFMRKFFVRNGVSAARPAQKFLIQAARQPLNPYFCTVTARKDVDLATTRADFCRIHHQRVEKIAVPLHHHAQNGIFVPRKMSRKTNRHDENEETRARHEPDQSSFLKKFFIF